VYFPTNSTISLRHLLKDGASYSGATVGREGFVGIAVLLGGKATLGRAVVQSAGWSFRLQATHLMEELARCGPVLHLLLRYTHAHFVQVAQNAVCSRHHSIDQQLARWLLQAMDGLDSDDLVLTHERVSDDLGVRRVSVTLSAGKYQRLGYIGLVRGHIVVLNRPALEQSACECYGVVRSLFQRLVLDIGQGDPQGVLD
jgi:CRP-like cAMP-binding protein